MLKYMLCGAVVMTASCFGMEKKALDNSINNAPLAVVWCQWCTYPNCFGPLPGSSGHCPRRQFINLLPPHYAHNNRWMNGLRNPRSSNSFEGT